MEVQLTADQKAFARQAVKSGRYNREEDALQEALSLWERQERRRAEILQRSIRLRPLLREAMAVELQPNTKRLNLRMR